jgi:hypothetical protein
MLYSADNNGFRSMFTTQLREGMLSDAVGYTEVEGRELWSDYVIFSNAWVKKKTRETTIVLKDANKPVIFLRWQ